jgi:hypothetical protein
MLSIVARLMLFSSGGMKARNRMMRLSGHGSIFSWRMSKAPRRGRVVLDFERMEAVDFERSNDTLEGSHISKLRGDNEDAQGNHQEV